MSFEQLLNTFEDEESVPKATYKQPVKYHQTSEEIWRRERSFNNPEAADYRVAVPVRKPYNKLSEDM